MNEEKIDTLLEFFRYRKYYDLSIDRHYASSLSSLTRKAADWLLFTFKRKKKHKASEI